MATRKLKPQFMAVTSPIPDQSKYKLISDLGCGYGSITEITIVERHAFSGVHLGIDKHWWRNMPRPITYEWDWPFARAISDGE